MAGLAVASLVQGGFDLHWVDKTQASQVGLILIAVPFLLQGVASVFGFLARDTGAGTALGLLAGTWLAIGLVHIVAAPGARSAALGLMLFVAAAMLVCAAVAIAIAKPLPAAVFAATALRLALAGIYELGGAPAWRDAAGLVAIGVVALAGYCGLAFALEDQLQRPVLPTFRRGRGRAAVLGSAQAAVSDVIHEPGVRQTT